MSHEAIGSGEAELALRTKPPPVTRLSRRALALICGAGAAALAGMVAFGMTTKLRMPAQEPELSRAGSPPEAVRLLPQDYRAPRLGPPLPGDLGRPMLAADAQAADQELAPAGDHRSTQPTEADAARRSQLFLVSGRASARAREVAADVSQFGQSGPPRIELHGGVRPLASPHVLQAGTMVAAAMITGVRSDVPGQVVAQVTQSVYDSPTGRILLVPQGARLLGAYESRTAFGQRRLHLTWTRLMLPNGKSVVLNNFPAGDGLGQAGLEDGVDRHWSTLFAMAGLSTILSVGAEIGADDDDDVAQAIRRGFVDTFNEVGQQAVGQGLAVPPTLTIRPGAPVYAIVTEDLILEPYGETTP